MLGPNDVALKMRPGEITAHCGIFLLCISLGNTASDQNLYQLSKSEMLRKKRVGGSTFPPKKPDSLSTLWRRSEWIPGVEGSVAKCSWGSSAVKCANWKLARESNSQFQTLLTETKFQVYGRIKRWRRHLQTVWICFLPSFSIWGFTWCKMIEEKELTNVTWYQEDGRKVDIYHNMFV